MLAIQDESERIEYKSRIIDDDDIDISELGLSVQAAKICQIYLFGYNLCVLKFYK